MRSENPVLRRKILDLKQQFLIDQPRYVRHQPGHLVALHPVCIFSDPRFSSTFEYFDPTRIFGKEFVDQVKAMGIKQVLSAPRSPWQRAYVERVIGTIRRECLDHVIVFNERSLYRYLRDFIEYYHRTRTHLGLRKDTPEFRPVQSTEAGRIISIPEVGGLHHRYERYAA